MSKLAVARSEIATVRKYTRGLLEDLSDGDWFRQPAEGVTHIAWQVGHVAMAQYRLVLERVRGARPDDGALISQDFLVRFARGSVPDPDPAVNPPIGDILSAFDRVYDQACRELATYNDAELETPPLNPHPLLNTKLDALFWSARHEVLHAGQIGLVRRLLGKPPRW